MTTTTTTSTDVTSTTTPTLTPTPIPTAAAAFDGDPVTLAGSEELAVWNNEGDMMEAYFSSTSNLQ